MHEKRDEPIDTIHKHPQTGYFYDQDNNLLCYLYLQNKTFLNAHLIKEGLVDVDTSIDYKLKRKFSMVAERN